MEAHLVTLGVCPHEPKHGEAGLCAAVHKPDHLNGGHAVDDNLCQNILQLARRAIRCALCEIPQSYDSSPLSDSATLPQLQEAAAAHKVRTFMPLFDDDALTSAAGIGFCAMHDAAPS